MLNKLAIGSIFGAAILVGAVVAFVMPVEQVYAPAGPDPLQQIKDSQFNQVISKRVTSADTTKDVAECTSDSDFLVHVAGDMGTNSGIFVLSEGIVGPGLSGDGSYTVGAEAGETIAVQAFVAGDFFVTLQTTAGATADCVLS